MKSVRIDDETYAKIVRHSSENSRSITATIKVLVEQGLAPSPASQAPAPQQPVTQPAQQPSPYDAMWAAYFRSNGTVLDESTHFATADEAIDFFAKSSKPIHTAASDKALGVKELIDMSDEMKSLKAEREKWKKETEAVADTDGDFRVPADKYAKAADKINAIYKKADNFMSKYQGLTTQ